MFKKSEENYGFTLNYFLDLWMKKKGFQQLFKRIID
jgi:hypothetical protein